MDARTEEKESKVQPQLVPFQFVMEMAQVFGAGLTNGREPDGWMDLDRSFVINHYRGALLRHYAAREWVAVAVNACILWYHDK